VAVPVRTAYNQWTQFEEFPRFMEGVERIEQLTPTRTHWVTEIAGVKREFDAEITEQIPDQLITWSSTEQPWQAGVVTFQQITPEETRVSLAMEFAPDGFAEQAADKLHLVERRVKGDLQRFQNYIEGRGTESGAWRGQVGQDPYS